MNCYRGLTFCNVGQFCEDNACKYKITAEMRGNAQAANLPICYGVRECPKRDAVLSALGQDDRVKHAVGRENTLNSIAWHVKSPVDSEKIV